MRTANPLIVTLYRSLRFPGHPIHLEHILDGRWSRMDEETIRYHTRANREKLSAESMKLLETLIERRGHASDEERQAVRELLNLVDTEVAHIAPGFINIVMLGAPLLAGIASIIVLGTAGIRERWVSERMDEPTKLLSAITSRLVDVEARLAALEEENRNLRGEMSAAAASLPDLIGEKVPEVLAAELSKFSLTPDSMGEASAEWKALELVVEQNRRAVENLTQDTVILRQTSEMSEDIVQRVKGLESLVMESPEAIVSLRLLERDVNDLMEEVTAKADADLLLEKELRLQEGFSKDIAGLSRELGILRWVVYLLVIGLTASGGIIVAMQRSRQ